jgi:hypothetical protein
MLIIGCDFHTRYQQMAMAREETETRETRGQTGRFPGRNLAIPQRTN